MSFLKRIRSRHSLPDWRGEAGQSATEYALLLLVFIGLFILVERATTQYLQTWFEWFLDRIAKPAV